MTFGPSAATLTLLEKLAVDNGFDRELPREGEWLAFASTQSPLRIWLSAPGEALFAVALSQSNVAAAFDLGTAASSLLPAGAVASRAVADIPSLHRLVRRAFQLSKTLPHELLHTFERQTVALPRSTEAERLVVQRLGQNVFRSGLLEYWEGRCGSPSSMTSGSSNRRSPRREGRREHTSPARRARTGRFRPHLPGVAQPGSSIMARTANGNPHRQPAHSMHTEITANLKIALQERTATIGILGLGYVGLPLAIGFIEAGFRVLGFDTDPDKVSKITRAEDLPLQIDGDRVRRPLAEGRLEVTTDPARLAEPDALLICVPTPLTRHREPDLSFIVAASRMIATRLRPGQLVVLESTTFPGTTDEIVLPILSESGLTCGRDFFLAYSPEREDPGNPQHTATQVPKVVGGVDEISALLAVDLYAGIVPQIVPVSSARAAEAAKLTENIFRAVNIALVNELKIVYARMNIDIWEVLDAAATKPFGFMRFNPGPGWGGHCIPVDPFYLAWKAREFGLSTHFIELAGEVNDRVRRFVVRRLRDALNERGKPLKDSKVLVLGIAYKKNVADARESPAFDVMGQLLQLGAVVSYHDPHIPRTPNLDHGPKALALESTPLTEDRLAAADAVLIVTDHAAIDFDLVLRCAPLIIDTRAVYGGHHPHVVRA